MSLEQLCKCKRSDRRTFGGVEVVERQRMSLGCPHHCQCCRIRALQDIEEVERERMSLGRTSLCQCRARRTLEDTTMVASQRMSLERGRVHKRSKWRPL